MYRSEKKIKTLICIITALIFIFFSFMLNGVWADEDENIDTNEIEENEQTNENDDGVDASVTEVDLHPRTELSTCRIAVIDEYGDIISYEYYDSLEEAGNEAAGHSDKYQIEILVEEIELGDTITLDYSKVITTAPELLEQGKRATIKRKSTFTGTMISCASLSVENINFDGGWNDNHSGTVATGPIINSTSKVTLANTTLKNNYNASSDGGGAIVSTAGVPVEADDGTVIQNCASTYAGAIKATWLTANGLKVNKCYSTNESENNASAIYVSAYSGFQINNLEVTNCVAVNAVTGGAAVFVAGGANFGTQDGENFSINISNNYSSGTYSGFYQNTGWTPINIYTDMVINGNKSGCTIDDNWNVVSKGPNSNLNITNMSPVYINTDITSASKVGVTVHNAYAQDGVINFANYSGYSGVEDGYFADSDRTAAFSNGGWAAAIGDGDVIIDPPDEEKAVIKIMQEEESGISHTYKVIAYTSGTDWADESNIIFSQEYTLTGTTTSSNCIELSMDAGSDVTIVLDNWWCQDIVDGNKSVTVESTSLAEGITALQNISGGDVQYYTYFGVTSVSDDTSVITYKFSAVETPPDTGFKEDVAAIIFFIVIVSVYGIILIKMKE